MNPTLQYHKIGSESRLARQIPLYLLCCAVFSCSSLKAHAAETDAWVLKQHSQLAGNHTIYVCQNAVRIENIENQYVILLRAPDWRVLIYNTTSKKACTKEEKNFNGTLGFGSGMMGEGGYLQSLPLKNKPVEDQFKGLKAVRYTTGHLAAPTKRSTPADVSNSIFGATDLESAQYWVWPFNVGAAKAGTVMQKIYRVPQRAGLPLNLSYVSIAGQKSVEIDTLIVKKTRVDDAKFASPKGLITVKSEDEVVFDDFKKKKINRAAEMFDGWRESLGRE